MGVDRLVSTEVLRERRRGWRAEITSASVEPEAGDVDAFQLPSGGIASGTCRPRLQEF